MAKAPKTSADSRLATIQIQHEYVKRLRDRYQDKKGQAKHAKANLDAALEDLEKLTGPNGTGLEFAGALIVDPATDEITTYKSIADLEDEEAEERQAAAERKKNLPFEAQALDTTSPTRSRDQEIIDNEMGRIHKGPTPKKRRKVQGKDAASGERDDEEAD